MNKVGRIAWIDISKGILIVLMILGHISILSRSVGINDEGCLSFYDLPHYYVRCFFMQAFFILSGYTSNFNKDFKPFFKGLIKGIIVPYLFFAIASKIIGVCFFNEGLYSTINNESILFIFESFWFLHALFISKAIIWLLNRIGSRFFSRWSDLVILLFLLLLVILSISISQSFFDKPSPSHYRNFFHYRNAFAMAIFIWFGVILRKKQINMKIYLFSLVFFFAATVSSFIFEHLGHDVSLWGPVHYTHESDIHTLLQLPSYLIYSITGSLSLFYIVQRLQKSKLLNLFTTIGINSIIYYCSHFTIVCILAKLLSRVFVPYSLVQAVLWYILILVGALIAIYLLSKVLNNKHLSWLIGK